MSIQIHYIKGIPYEYDHHREGDKVICDYIGRSHNLPKKEYKHPTNKEKVTQHNDYKSDISAGINYIRDMTIEKGLIYDSETSMLLSEKEGKEDRIRFNESDVKNMHGNILIHNHPEDSSLSYNDYNIVGHYKLKEIRAISSNYEYSLKIISQKGYINCIDIDKTLSKEFIRKEREYKKLYKTLEWEEITHKLNKSISKNIEGIEYKRTRL